MEQALQDKGLSRAASTALLKRKRNQLFPNFSGTTTCQPTGTVDEQTAKRLGVEIMPSARLERQRKEQSGTETDSAPRAPRRRLAD